jgi:hypothetical protein
LFVSFDVSCESRKQGASSFVSQGVPYQASLPSLASDYSLQSFCRAKRLDDRVLDVSEVLKLEFRHLFLSFKNSDIKLLKFLKI